MKVLIAPANPASFSSILATSLNKIPGITCRGLAVGRHPYLPYPEEEWLVIEQSSWRKTPWKRFKQNVRKYYHVLRLILWADVIHWVWDIEGLLPLNLHYLLIKLLRKPCIIEWVGSEIRVPEIVFGYSPNYKRAWELKEWEYTYESLASSEERQRRLKKINALPAVCPEMSLFVNPHLFRRYYPLNVRVDINDYTPQYPDEHNELPVIVHSPSALGAKGTKYVREIMERLRAKGLNFSYKEITGVTKDKVLEAMKASDIFLDHFIYGSFGMASCEAMAFGKPVFSYLLPPVADLLPGDSPIINASLDELEEKLALFIRDGKLRREYGERSRRYAEQYHDANKIARHTLGLYTALIERKEEAMEKFTQATNPKFYKEIGQ